MSDLAHGANPSYSSNVGGEGQSSQSGVHCNYFKSSFIFCNNTSRIFCLQDPKCSVAGVAGYIKHLDVYSASVVLLLQQ